MILRDGQWAGERCFVIGGGPSLRGFDWSRLDGERVIAVNRAYEILPRAIVCSMDKTFWREHGKAVAQIGDGWNLSESPPVAVHVRVGDERLPRHGPSVILPCVDGGRDGHLSALWGTSLQSGLGCGGNSGFAAVNLADVLGASTIYLLGFDMTGSPEGRTCNWHDGYQSTQNAAVYGRMRAAFCKVASQIRGRVINITRGSALKAFPMEFAGDVI